METEKPTDPLQKTPSRLDPGLDRPRGIPLSAVLEGHRAYRVDDAVPDNLGDAFLCATNPVFLNIRRAFSRQGGTFDAADPEDCLTFPLMSLDRMLDSGAIPYRRNLPWLESLERSAPGAFDLVDLGECDLHRNYLFHEAAHQLAHAAWLDGERFERLPRTRATLAGLLIGESFANSVECLSSAFVVSEIGSYFLAMNNHFAVDLQDSGRMLEIAGRRGFPAVLKALVLGFFHANCLYQELEEPEHRGIAELSGLDRVEDARLLGRLALELSETFRTRTARLFFRKLGFIEEWKALVAGPRPVLDEVRPRLDRLERLAELACQGLENGLVWA